MKIYPDTKVYVLCPAVIQTGGPESLHQLASQLIAFGVETSICYCTSKNTPTSGDIVHEAYRKYHVPYVSAVEDSSRNILVMPETATYIAVNKKCRRVIWWMSVNNYLENILNVINEHLENPLAEPLTKFFYFNSANGNFEHWGQSEYVRQFLRLNGVKKIQTVETHMSQTFLSRVSKVDFSAKKNFVAYNPRKGFEFTEQLIELAPEIDWRPIENMTPAQVQELLAQAKVYIDFGTFPGRERLPREAILSGCVVITGKRGAAANDVDINIPAEFKFGLKDTKPYDVIEKIKSVFDNFEREFDKQKAFREHELNAQKNFAAEVAAAFEIKKFPPPSVAFTQGVGEKSFLLAEEFFRENNFTPKFIVDDVLASTEISDELILREQQRNYLRVGKNLIEIITRDDAKFLYQEGRIKKFALFEPSDDEIVALKNFYEPNDADVLLVDR